MSKAAWKDFASRLLEKIDFRTEYENLGLRTTKSDGTTVQGYCPFHEDTNPSFSFYTDTGHWKCFSGCGENGGGSFSDFAMRKLNLDYKETLLHYAQKLGVKPPAADEPPSKPAIKPEITEKYHQQLLAAKDKLDWLITGKRGFTMDAITRFQIGWNGRNYTFPVLDENKQIVNIRLYTPEAKDTGKMTSYTNGDFRYGEVRLYGLDQLVGLPLSVPVILCEGEHDRIVLEQHGICAVTGTGGAGVFKKDWPQYFTNRNVYICYDNDDPGRSGARNAAIMISPVAASLRMIALPNSVGPKGDITDFFVKLEQPVEAFQTLMTDAPLYAAPKPKPVTPTEPDVAVLTNFSDIDNPAYADKRVQVALTVCGETSEAFHATTEFEIVSCKKMDAGKCYVCTENNPKKVFTMNSGDSEFIGSCMSSDDQIIGMLRRKICPFGEKPQINITKKVTVREFFAQQHSKRFVNYIAEFQQGSETDTNKSEDKKVYYIADYQKCKLEKVRTKSYMATGYVKSHPKTQQVSLLIDNLVEVEDDFEKFDLTVSLPVLQSIHGERTYTDDPKVDYDAFQERLVVFLNDLSDNVIKVYQRQDVVFAMMMVFCSVLKLNFNNDDSRGWLNLVVAGDSGTAKSLIYNRLATYIGVGDITSATSSSRTGIVYGLSEHKQKGWQIKAGRLPANSQKILCLDEAQKLDEQELGAMQEAIDGGYITVDKISSGGFETMTRFIALCNPKNDHLTIADYACGCQVLSGIFPGPFIRRFDLAMITAQSDIANYDEINSINTGTPAATSSAQMQALVFWAWTRRPENVIISDDVTELILRKASEISSLFGYASDILLVAPSDFRKKLIRMVVACAVIDVSCDSTGANVIVRPEHVLWICDWIKNIYTAKNFRLDEYSRSKRGQQVLDEIDYAEILSELRGMINIDSNFIATGFIRVFMANISFVTRDAILEQVGCNYEQIKRLMKLFKSHNLLKTSKYGYSNTAKLNQALTRLREDLKEELMEKDSSMDMEDGPI